jgi:hypothetical protein
MKSFHSSSFYRNHEQAPDAPRVDARHPQDRPRAPDLHDEYTLTRKKSQKTYFHHHGHGQFQCWISKIPSFGHHPRGNRYGTHSVKNPVARTSTPKVAMHFVFLWIQKRGATPVQHRRGCSCMFHTHKQTQKRFLFFVFPFDISFE